MGHDATSMYLPHRKQKGHGSLVQGVRATKIEKKKLDSSRFALGNRPCLPSISCILSLFYFGFLEKVDEFKVFVQ